MVGTKCVVVRGLSISRFDLLSQDGSEIVVIKQADHRFWFANPQASAAGLSSALPAVDDSSKAAKFLKQREQFFFAMLFVSIENRSFLCLLTLMELLYRKVQVGPRSTARAPLGPSDLRFRVEELQDAMLTLGKSICDNKRVSAAIRLS